MANSIDILMITHNRPAYTRLTLPRLLETCDSSMRVWIWQNGDDRDTIEVVKSVRAHPRVHRVNLSSRNEGLREPTNWMFQESDGTYVSKVDDDCLMPDGWAGTLRQAHEGEPRLGVLACWHFLNEDFQPALSEKKIERLGSGHQVLRNCWTPGSGYLMKRRCVEQNGRIRVGESFTDYCIRLARSGWINGWHFPLVCQEHLDDPRSRHCQLRDPRAFARYAPLSARNFGATNLDEWQAQLRRSARIVQEAPADPRAYSQWRRRVRRTMNPIRRMVGLPERGW